MDDTFWLGGTLEDHGAAVWTNTGQGWELNFSYNDSGARYEACAFDSYNQDNESFFLAVGSVKNLGVDILFYEDGAWEFAGNGQADHDPEGQSGNYDAPIRVLSIDTGDINGDGNTDLVAGYLDGGLRIWLGDGEGHWSNITQGWRDTSGVEEDEDYYFVTLTHFDEDPYLDILSCHKNDSVGKTFVDVFLGDGSGGWDYDIRLDTWDYSFNSIIPLNVDGDKDFDFIGLDSNKDGIQVLLNHGSAITEYGENPTNNDKFSWMTSFDLDFDGYQDIIASYKDSPANPQGIAIFYGREGAEMQEWENGVSVTLEENFNSVFVNPDYDTMLTGGPEKGVRHNHLITGLNSATKERCLENWKTSLPFVKEIDFSQEGLLPWRFYQLNVTVSGGSLSESWESISTLEVNLETTEGVLAEFTWYENGASSYLEMVSGEDHVYIDEEWILASYQEEIRSTVVSFPISFSFANGEFEGGFASASVLDDQGFESGVTTPVGEKNRFSLYPEIYLEDFVFSDRTLNPTDTTNVSGNLFMFNKFTGEREPFFYENLNTIQLLESESTVAKAELLNLKNEQELLRSFEENRSFSLVYNFNELGSGTYHYFLAFDIESSVSGIPLAFGQHSFDFEEETRDIFMNFLALKELRPRNYLDFRLDEGIYWQQSGKEIMVRADVVWNSSMEFDGEDWVEGGDDFYAGEVILKTLEGNLVTSGLELVFSNNTDALHTSEVEALPNSAVEGDNNSFGKHLVIEGTVSLEMGWDGEAPYIDSLDPTNSLFNGSEVKPENTEVILIVKESRGFENQIYDELGKLTLHWEGNISGSAQMNMEDRTEFWLFRATIPFSTAEEDDIVFFWITGNDSLGNPLESRLGYLSEHPSLLFDGVNNNSRGVAFVDPTPPGTPVGLRVVENDGYLVLRWTANADGDTRGYYVYKMKEGDSEFRLVVSRKSPVRYPYFKDDIVTNGLSYTYKISAVDYALIPNESPLSEPATGMPQEEEETDPLAKLTDYATENFEMVFFGGVGLVIFIITLVVGLRSRHRDGDKESSSSSGVEKSQSMGEQPSSTFAPSSGDLTRLDSKEQEVMARDRAPLRDGTGGGGSFGGGELAIPNKPLPKIPEPAAPTTRIQGPQNQNSVSGIFADPAAADEPHVLKKKIAPVSTCPKCNTFVNEELTFCTMCGQKLK